MKRLFGIGDIHGCYDTLRELSENRIRPDSLDKLVFLGDYIDRGPGSRQVIDYIIDLIKYGIDVVPLAGNHEAMLIDAYRDPSSLPLWLLNSGDTTLDSFGVTDAGLIDKKYTDFFLGLRYYNISGKFIFVHAGFNDNAPDPFGDINGMIWESHPSYDNPLLKEYTIIHGHRPKSVDFVLSKIREHARVIPIDTGCVYGKERGYGFLSALEVNTMELISVERSDQVN